MLVFLQPVAGWASLPYSTIGMVGLLNSVDDKMTMDFTARKVILFFI
jgi:hypothetical protein